MSQFIKLADTFRFGVTTHDASGLAGTLVDADETPRWSVFEDASDTPILEGNFTGRTGYVGTYKGTFDATLGNGFNSTGFYEVHASGKVNNIVGRSIIHSFVVNDIYDANIVQISGANTPGAFLDTNIIEISSDATAANNLELQYDTTGLTGDTFPARQDTIITPSGAAHAVWEKPLSEHTTANTFGSALQPVYYADIKYTKDIGNSADEYSVCWFKNGATVASGDLTNPAISVYNTSTGASLFSNETLTYASTALGVTRFNSGLATPSGEAFMVSVSGTIDSATREWKKLVGLDDIF